MAKRHFRFVVNTSPRGSSRFRVCFWEPLKLDRPGSDEERCPGSRRAHTASGWARCGCGKSEKAGCFDWFVFVCLICLVDCFVFVCLICFFFFFFVWFVFVCLICLVDWFVFVCLICLVCFLFCFLFCLVCFCLFDLFG